MIEELFEKIRQEEIILFVGAGTSLDAGYPTGTELKKTFYNNLNSSEKKFIDENLSLADLTEEFCRIKNDNRKSLNRILYNQFVLTKPKTLSWHKKLALISHIKTIITTNYDNLLEKGYGDKAEVFINSDCIKKKSKGIQTDIYKIHGDPSNFESLIITKGDYTSFFTTKEADSIYWTEIKSKVINNSIAFIGYSLEDINVNSVFDQIWEALGKETLKNKYFISPDISEYKKRYLENKGFCCIDLKANDFLNRLKKNIEKNVVNDFNSNKLSMDTLYSYSKNYGLSPKITNKDGKPIVDFFESTEKMSTFKLNFDLIDDNNIKNRLDNFITDGDFNPFVIDGDRIKNSSFQFGKIFLPKNLEKILILPKPVIEDSFDIRFKNGFVYNNIKAELFKSNSNAEIRAKLINSDCTFKFVLDDEINSDIFFTYTHNQKCGKLKDEIEEATLIKSMFSGSKCFITSPNYSSFEYDCPVNEDFIKIMDFNIKYFEALENIQAITFKNFSNIDFSDLINSNYDLVKIVLAYLKNEAVEITFKDSLTIDYNIIKDKNENFLAEIQNGTLNPIFYNQNEKDQIELHGVKFTTGYRFCQLRNPYIVNLNEIQSKRTNILILKSNSNKLICRYTDELHI